MELLEQAIELTERSWNWLEGCRSDWKDTWKNMEGHGRTWKLVEYSVFVTIYQHVWPGVFSKLLELSHSVLYQLYKGSVERSMRIILSTPTGASTPSDLFPTRKYMKINNLSRFRPSERLQGNRNFVPKYRGKIQPPLKLVERGYADLFPTRKHMEINNLLLLRPPKKHRGDRNFVPKYRGKIQPSLK